MADYPDTAYKMRRAGYTLVYSRPCAKCKAATDRWRTSRGRETTMDHSDDQHANLQAHFKTCAVALRTQDQREHEAEPLYKFAARTHAAAVVAVDRHGNYQFEVDKLCDPADMHIALSNAADAVRDHLVQIVQQEQS